MFLVLSCHQVSESDSDVIGAYSWLRKEGEHLHRQFGAFL